MGEKLGEYLKRKREEKNLTLEDISKESRIQKRYLEALEKEEYAELPGETYIKGFLRNYCSIIGINGDEIVGRYDKELEREREEAFVEETVKKDWKEKKLIVNSLVAVLVLVLFYLLVNFVGFIYKKYNKDKKVTVQNTTATVEEKPQVKEERTEALKENEVVQEKEEEKANVIQEEEKAVEAVNTITTESSTKISKVEDVKIENIVLKEIKIKASGASWLEIYEGKKTIYTGVIHKGEEKIIKSKDRIVVKVGDAGFIKIEANGKDIGVIGKSKEVVRKEF